MIGVVNRQREELLGCCGESVAVLVAHYNRETVD